MVGHYFVESSSGKGGYLVNDEGTCADAQERVDIHKGFCTHQDKPRGRKNKARTEDLDTPAKQTLAMNASGHWTPGTRTRGDDGHSDEQLRDLVQVQATSFVTVI